MKKHFAFIKSSIYQAWMYKFNVIGWLIGSSLFTLVSIFLWHAIFNEIDSGIIVQQGIDFTFPLMVTYVLCSQIIGFTVNSSDTFFKLGHDIREGQIAINLTKPINYRTRLRDECLGHYIGYSLFTSLPAIIVVFLCVHYICGISFPFWYNIIYFFISVTLSVLIFDAFNFLFGQIAFFTGALFGVMLIKDTFLQFFSGAMIPLSFLPTGLADTLRILPFSSLMETPVFLLLNIYDTQGALSFFNLNIEMNGALIGFIKIAVQFIWLIVLETLCYASNRRIIKHVVSVGG